jgi:hypothetical protein
VSRLRRIRDGAMSNNARLGRRAREREFGEAATRAQCADKASKGASGGPFASLSPKRQGPPLLLGEITLGPMAAHRIPRQEDRPWLLCEQMQPKAVVRGAL